MTLTQLSSESSPASNLEPLAAQVMDWCDQLATLSAMPDGIHRFYLTPEHQACNKQVAIWMRQASMQTHIDAAGNLIGRYASDDPQAKTLIIGSHLDTIPNAGRYDGILGVLLPIAIIGQLARSNTKLPFHIDVIGFGDEEGIRFGATLLGSRAVAGTWQPAWWQLQDSDGIKLNQAFEHFGLSPTDVGQAAYDAEQLLAYLEVHIEQGPVLEQQDLAVGIVSAIAGARRFQINIQGHAGHAGTVPMTMRQDALLGASEAILLIEHTAKEFGVVATVGQIECGPGAVNVIPGNVTFSLDIRSVDDGVRDAAVTKLQQRISTLCEQRQLTNQWRQIHQAPAVKCAPWLIDLQRQTMASLHQPTLELMSGAGHDAMALADITDIAMYFVRCKGGISHHPAESVTHADVAAALVALQATIVTLGQAVPAAHLES
ncbi:Zn-dependent hydrolase [Neiella marina]|uniref:Zn-dependent hydrolase n=1 Tax=Neiella marina TaxID=508461 RepID=A0A8J2U403_9GAMM|nr:allantoate amidohydrolase [Neiella marina]GGA73034.1 Zn-dependent hydrolase [Neiella marina]